MLAACVSEPVLWLDHMSDPRWSKILVKVMAVPGLQLCKPRDFLLMGKSEADERLTEGISKVDIFDPMEAWHQQRGILSGQENLPYFNAGPTGC